MPTPHIHIISFDIPYPADYGGAIDVFYSLRALHQAGVAVTLHCTYKGELVHHKPLEEICQEVFYYPRNTGYKAQLHLLPYGICSRIHPELLNRLLQDHDPILFEGLVSCYYLNHPALEGRKKIFRECNIEHDYYRGLAKASRSIRDKVFYYLEAWKLQRYESVVRSASSIAAVAHQDEQYFTRQYPSVPTYYIPSFHANDTIRSQEGQGAFILYHGNLQVPENEHAVYYLLRQVMPQLPQCRFAIAGRNPSPSLKKAIEALPNCRLYDTPDAPTMERLIRDAHIHLLPTFQATGLKLKLLNVLYNGRFVIVNPHMVHGTDLAELCHVAHSDKEMIDMCKRLIMTPFSAQEIQHRQTVLAQHYHNNTNVQQLLKLITV